MKPTPKDWPRFSSAIFYENAGPAIDWLCAAFGFEIKIKVEGENGRIEHCELVYGDGLLMVGQQDLKAERAWKRQMRSPLALDGANTQSVMFYVDDALAHCARARAHGARIVDEPTIHDYGQDFWADRSYGALDLESHLWWITERVRNPPEA